MMAPRDTRPLCKPETREHADGADLVLYLIANGGSVTATHEEIARQLGMVRRVGGGVALIDRDRYHRARNHVHVRVNDTGEPCCGYTIEYRRSGPMSQLALIDPTGDLGPHANAAIASILGWMSRERQHHTENTRMTTTFNVLAGHALARGDQYGCLLVQRAALEIETAGTVGPETMGLLREWAGSL